jgi:hypothetical protein
MDDEAQKHGQQLADRIITQARRYGLKPRDMAIMFMRDVETHTKAMAVHGASPEEISLWAKAVSEGCRRRIDQEVQRQAVGC